MQQLCVCLLAEVIPSWLSGLIAAELCSQAPSEVSVNVLTCHSPSTRLTWLLPLPHS